ncbi:MAG: hypothetical protein H5T69_00935 [Chloroflexi bacterium]|nr:hypothetical protein [Chloroflexota bacterium]
MKVHVSPGVCGLEAVITAEANAMYEVTLTIHSDCERVRRLAEGLSGVSALDELRAPLHETATYKAAGRAGLHVACPVPCAVLKAMEVACGLALPADVQIQICR